MNEKQLALAVAPASDPSRPDFGRGGGCATSEASASSGWSDEDLVRRIGRALDVAEAAVGLLGDVPAGLDLDRLEAPPDKIIAETAILLRAVASLPTSVAPDLVRRARALARTLLPHARHARVLVGIALHPAVARDYAVAHLSLASMGYPDARIDRALAESVAAPTAGARERFPYRELEQGWLAWLGGGAPPTDEAIERTSLVTGVDLLTGSRDDVYAFTHAVMYATDFGLRAARLPRPTEDVLATAESALAGALDDDDFDVAGELLFAWPCLGAEWSAMSSLAFGVLARVEDEVGVLPSLGIDRAEYERQPPGTRGHYVAAVAYHTAYVMGILCASVLRGRRRPQPAQRGPVARRALASLARHLLSWLDADARRPQWRRDLDALPPERQGALVPFLIDVALRRAVRGVDLVAVRYLLQTALAAGVASSPLCAQAAGVLRRLASWQDLLTPPAPTTSPG